MKFLCVFIGLFALAAASTSETDGLLASTLTFVKECGDKSMVLCLKVRRQHLIINKNRKKK